MKTYIDLHIHSTASDGTFSPTEIINDALKLAGDKNPVVIALTDHDTVAGTEEFQKAAAKHKERLTAISGVEISTDYHGVEIHVLGYNIDTKNKALLERLAVCRESRDVMQKLLRNFRNRALRFPWTKSNQISQAKQSPAHISQSFL